TDFDALKRHIASRLDLEANLSDTRAFLLRTEKAIEKERAWLAKYDEEGYDVAMASEQDGETDVDVAETYSLHGVFEKIASDRLDDISLGEVRLIIRRYAEMTRTPLTGSADSIDPGDEHVKQAVRKAMAGLDETLDGLRRAWQRVKDL
ncbi:MAG: hypothetical protein GWP08_00670, partial [Nitrospiraceae bacterium]|nr:hypothetical protein [Nitrospiraceae bacterium]